ncbi:hypothetical protein ACIQNI_13310 [Streptomyces sp. NPDC091266]|uniref:hypothetical protein n=1 Tax=Streptomyces sp. NPDC091266 TaxID=3365978 RepID=UPI0038270647
MDHLPAAHPAPVDITLDLLYELLGIERHWEPILLLRNARIVRGHLPPLVLSVARTSGAAMGPGSLAELDRMQRRAATYRAIADELTRIPGTRVLKGPSLAARYPQGVLRPLGDLDVVVPDEPRLWQAASRVLAGRPVDGIDITVLRADGTRHTAIALHWPSEDPMIDPELKVEISTFAYPGDSGAVPLRAATPPEQVQADVLALAEERFQRPFTAKDMLDLAVVFSSPGLPPWADLARSADRFRLAPELLELCQAVSGLPALAHTVPRELTHALEERASAEQDRRRSVAVDAAPADRSAPVRERLDAGMPVHGMLLKRADTPRADAYAVTEDFSDGTLLRTPVGDFLLVDGEIVDPGQYESALAAVREAVR